MIDIKQASAVTEVIKNGLVSPLDRMNEVDVDKHIEDCEPHEAVLIATGTDAYIIQDSDEQYNFFYDGDNSPEILKISESEAVRMASESDFVCRVDIEDSLLNVLFNQAE